MKTCLLYMCCLTFSLVATTEKEDELIARAEEGDKNGVEQLIKENVNINVQDEDGDTPLGKACMECKPAIVEVLMNNNVKLDITQNGLTPLHMAAHAGCVEVAKLLLQKGVAVDVRSTNDKRTPLHEASAEGKFGMVEFLLKNKADVNAVNVNNWTPLAMATSGGYKSIVQKLLDADADKNIKNNKNQLPLDIAREKNLNDIQDVLVGKDLDLFACALEELTH